MGLGELEDSPAFPVLYWLLPAPSSRITINKWVQPRRVQSGPSLKQCIVNSSSLSTTYSEAFGKKQNIFSYMTLAMITLQTITDVHHVTVGVYEGASFCTAGIKYCPCHLVFTCITNSQFGRVL